MIFPGHITINLNFSSEKNTTCWMPFDSEKNENSDPGSEINFFRQAPTGD